MIRGASESRYGWRLDAIGTGICLVMCALAYLGGVQPMLSRHDRYAQQRATLEAQREKAAESAATLLAVKRERDTGRANLLAAPLKLQPSGQVNQRMALLSSLAAACGTTIDDLQPGRAVPGTRYDTLAVHLTGSGSYQQAAALAHQIRSNFTDIGLTGLDISGRPTDPTGKTMFRYEMIWYTAPSLKPGPTVTADAAR